MSFRLQVLGGVALEDEAGESAGVPRGKPIALVAFLAMNPEGAERDYLARLLWSGGDPSKGRHSVRQALSKVRQVLGSDAVVGSDPVRLERGHVELDFDELREAMAAGEVDKALELWKGEPFAGLSISGEDGWTAWVGKVRAEAHAMLAAGLEDAAGSAVSRGSPDDAIRYLEKATEVLPERAEAWERLVEVQTDFGRIREARTTLGAAWTALDAGTYEARMAEHERRVSHGGDPSTVQSEVEMLGREADLAAVAEAWRKSKEGRTGFLAFRAGPGGGKSRMLREAAAPLVAPGAHVIRFDCHPVGDAVVETRTVVREMVRELSTLPGASHAMSRVVEQLADLDGRTVEQLVDPFLDLVTSVCRQTPVLITLDDVEWIDLDSWELIRRLVRLRPACALLIVASMAGGGRDDEGPSSDVVAWWDKGWVQIRSLRELSGAEVEAAIRLRGWRDDRFVLALRDMLLARSKGLPAVTFGLLDGMALAGIRPPPPGSSPDEGHEAPRFEELPLTDGLLRYYGARLIGLSPLAQQLLPHLRPTAPVQLETLSYAASFEAESVRRAIGELAQERFVIQDGEGYRLAHPDYVKLSSQGTANRQASVPAGKREDERDDVGDEPPWPAAGPDSEFGGPPRRGRSLLGSPAREARPRTRPEGSPPALVSGASSGKAQQYTTYGREPTRRKLGHLRKLVIPRHLRPRAPAYVAAAILAGIIWMLWRVFT